MNTLKTFGEDPHRLAVERVVTSFGAQLAEPPRLSDMARLACMSPFHFDRVFRRITGLPPRKFLAAMRMRMALERVLSTDTRITDICFDMGYESLGTFITQFKKSVGASPMRLRAISRGRSEGRSAARADAEQSSSNCQGSIWIRGRVHHQGEPVASACMGLFVKPSPEGTPLACGMSDGAGHYELRAPIPGRFHLFGVKLSAPEASRRIQVTAQLVCHITLSLDTDRIADIEMNAPLPTDPPLLSIVPVLSGGADAMFVRRAATASPLL